MDNIDKSSLDEIKADVKELVKVTIALTTKLDIYTNQHSDLEVRTRALEEHKHRQEGVNIESKKKMGQIMILFVAIQAFVGFGVFMLSKFWG